MRLHETVWRGVWGSSRRIALADSETVTTSGHLIGRQRMDDDVDFIEWRMLWMSSNGVLCGCHQIAAYILNKLGSGLVRSGDQQACIKHFKPRTKPQDCFHTLLELSRVICNPIGPPRGIPPLLPGVAPKPNDEPRRAGQGHRAGEDLRQASDALDGDGGWGRVRWEAEQRGQCLPVHAGQRELPEGPSRGACICLSELAFKVHPNRETSAELMYSALCSKPGMRKYQSGTH